MINFEEKFDDYGKDRTGKEKLMKDLREEVSSFKNEHEQLKLDVKTSNNTLVGTVSFFTVFQKNKYR